MNHCNQYERVVKMMVRGRDLARLVLVLVEAVSLVTMVPVPPRLLHAHCSPWP